MGADEVQAGPADGGHAHEVVGPGQEGAEGGGVGHPAPHLDADGVGDHLLLGDEALDVAVGVGLAEDLGEGGVGDLAVEGDHVAPGVAEGGQGLAVDLAGGDGAAQLVDGELQLAAGLEDVGLAVGGGRGDGGGDAPVAAELLDGARDVVEGLAVGVELVLDRLDALALLGAGQDHGGLAGGGHGLGEGGVDGVDVVAVELDDVPAEGGELGLVGLHVPPVAGGPALAEAVHVDDGDEVVELLVGRGRGRLPHRALGHLRVTADDPRAVGQLVEALGRDGDADGDGQALAEGAGGHVDPGQAGGGVALQPAADVAVGVHLVLGDRPHRLVDGVDQGGRVALGEDQVVGVGVLGVVEVVVQVLGDQHGHEVGGRHRRRGVPGLGRTADLHCVDPELLAEVTPLLGLTHQELLRWAAAGPSPGRVEPLTEAPILCSPSQQAATFGGMDIVSALFVEGIDMRQVPGPSTRFDLTGVMFSIAAPSPPPVTLSPHLIVFVRCRADEPGQATMEVRVPRRRRRGGGPQRPAGQRRCRASSAASW